MLGNKTRGACSQAFSRLKTRPAKSIMMSITTAKLHFHLESSSPGGSCPIASGSTTQTSSMSSVPRHRASWLPRAAQNPKPSQTPSTRHTDSGGPHRFHTSSPAATPDGHPRHRTALTRRGAFDTDQQTLCLEEERSPVCVSRRMETPAALPAIGF